MAAMIGRELCGTIVPLLTPLAPGESFDRRAMGRLLDFVLAEGAGGLMPATLTGEGPRLSEDETLEVWDPRRA
jgi:dihydrodipicolinate synthase/N-acetylneuraminate lyase